MSAAMGAEAQRSGRSRLRLDVRDVVPEDMAYVLDTWRKNWRRAPQVRHLPATAYRAYFDRVVRNGVLEQSDTVILVGASEGDPDWIWAWLCYTPDRLVPTVHYAFVRREIPTDDGRGRPVPLRRLRIMSSLVAAARVERSLVYTFRPARPEDESGLQEAAKRAGIVARYHSVEEFLRMRGRR